MRDSITYRIASHPLLALWLPASEARKLFASQLADIAIQAMTEPTRSMLLAGALAWTPSGNTTSAARRTWRWMVFAGKPGEGLPPFRRDGKGRIYLEDQRLEKALREKIEGVSKTLFSQPLEGNVS